MRRLPLMMLAAFVLGCATARPILYDNAKYHSVGRAGVDRDIEECRRLADEAGATPGAGKAGEAARSAGAGAVGGAAAGAIGGAIGGAAGTGAAAGAASGVVWSLFSWMFGWMGPSRPSEAHVNYVNLCLAERGYQVAGWQ